MVSACRGQDGETSAPEALLGSTWAVPFNGARLESRRSPGLQTPVAMKPLLPLLPP